MTMPEGQTQFKIDKSNLMKAGTIPVIAAAIGGALWLLGFFGGILGIFFWAVAAFAGYWYVNLVLKSGAKPSILEVAINGAILGAVVGLVYAVVTWIAISIRFSGVLVYAP
jgi:predicted PurR-regulated permease PerM